MISDYIIYNKINSNCIFSCYNKIMNEAEEIQQKIKDYFSQKSEIDTVLIFGSFAKGTFNQYSDVDIAIHSDSELDYEKLATI